MPPSEGHNVGVFKKNKLLIFINYQLPSTTPNGKLYTNIDLTHNNGQYPTIINNLIKSTNLVAKYWGFNIIII